MAYEPRPKDTDPTLARLLEELEQYDRELLQADRDLKLAQANYEVASVKFVAIREILRARMGRSPYAGGADVQGWRFIRDGDYVRVQFESKGRFRYYRMPPGDAVEEVLSEASEPMTVYEIASALADGGAEWVSGRAVNAALTNKVGKTVIKTGDGKYAKKSSDIYDPDELVGAVTDPDDLPF